MVKTKTAIAFDTFFVTIICFLILYSWFYKILKNAFLSLFICNLISICIYITIFKVEIKKYNLKNIKNKELNFAKDCLKTIQYFSTSEEKTFFENLLNSTQIEPKIFINQNSLFYINLKQPLSSHDFFKAHALKTDTFLNKDLSFICESIDDSFKSKNENFSSPYTVYNFTDLFKLMK